ncbi:ABC transporter ATP-binding protein [Bradyrhizobium sp. NP1]|uniref:ABC transporter ATP-binding protein n=1 Tax=Bradyrhizobium sp. NP1 TaxID=3049772 RepID=UPI0025A66CD9|nr:ABC transporter ATP-binding protein [Bradyrhizobium sp. NP1]WJR77433.1 ABC transporter ATP-binding protein [Bradyrhizobium sp. NP1]
MSLLEVNDIKVLYGHVQAVESMRLDVKKGEIVALVGSNGAGKSTIVKAIMGMAPVHSGTITFQGKPITGRRPSEIARHGIGLSPEGRRVFPEFTVRENLLAGAYRTDKNTIASRLEEIHSYFPRLSERASQLAASLSGGEQQMLAIGRALMGRPQLLLLDEPSLGLAPVVVQRIGEVVKAIRSKEGIAVLVAEQNSRWALSFADRGIVIEIGKLKMSASAAALRDDAYIQEAYFGFSGEDHDRLE